MLEHVLHDEVAEGVAAKLWSTGKHLPGAGGGHAIQPRNATQCHATRSLLDQWSCLLSRAMLQETLENSATCQHALRPSQSPSSCF